MEYFYSNIAKDKLLHYIFRASDFKQGRQDLINSEEFIQCSALQMNEGHTFKAHKHVFKSIDKVFPQESWIVMSGRVKCVFYDFDDTILAEPILEAGDASFSLWGGHNYLVLENNTRVMEYKCGPYLGQELDKKFI